MHRLYQNKKKREGSSLQNEVHNPTSCEIITAYNSTIFDSISVLSGSSLGCMKVLSLFQRKDCGKGQNKEISQRNIFFTKISAQLWLVMCLSSSFILFLSDIKAKLISGLWQVIGWEWGKNHSVEQGSNIRLGCRKVLLWHIHNPPNKHILNVLSNIL